MKSTTHVLGVGMVEFAKPGASDPFDVMAANAIRGALEDAGLSLSDVDGYFCAADAPGLGQINMVDYLGIKPSFVDSTDTGGSSYVVHVEHAVQAREAPVDEELGDLSHLEPGC